MIVICMISINEVLIIYECFNCLSRSVIWNYENCGARIMYFIPIDDEDDQSEK